MDRQAAWEAELTALEARLDALAAEAEAAWRVVDATVDKYGRDGKSPDAARAAAWKAEDAKEAAQREYRILMNA